MGFSMAGITLAQAEAQLDRWMAADIAVSTSQSHDMDGVQLTRADAKQIRENIVFWDGQVKRLTRGGIRVSLVAPC